MIELDIVVHQSTPSKSLLAVELFLDRHPLHPLTASGCNWLTSRTLKNDGDRAALVRDVYRLVDMASEQLNEDFELSESAREELIRILKG